MVRKDAAMLCGGYDQRILGQRISLEAAPALMDIYFHPAQVPTAQHD